MQDCFPESFHQKCGYTLYTAKYGVCVCVCINLIIKWGSLDYGNYFQGDSKTIGIFIR